LDRRRLAGMPAGGRRSHLYPEHPHRARDVLEQLLAEILESQIEPAGRILLDPGRDADPAGFRRAFEPGGDIDPVAKNVAVLDDDIADVDADAKFDPLRDRDHSIAPGHRLLHLGRAAQRIDDARELDEQPVAGGFDQPPAVGGDLRVDHLGADRSQPVERTFLINPDQARIAGDISRQNRGQPTFSPISPRGVHGSPA
jgi:hypothetical protein